LLSLSQFGAPEAAAAGLAAGHEGARVGGAGTGGVRGRARAGVRLWPAVHPQACGVGAALADDASVSLRGRRAARRLHGQASRQRFRGHAGPMRGSTAARASMLAPMEPERSAMDLANSEEDGE
ncbi:unnamed protein product, partial [Urochloa humidicola]